MCGLLGRALKAPEEWAAPAPQAHSTHQARFCHDSCNPKDSLQLPWATSCNGPGRRIFQFSLKKKAL